jgi:hypothetical protein
MVLKEFSAEDVNTHAIDEPPSTEQLSDEKRDALRRWIRRRYRNTAFQGVSETFIGWKVFRGDLYAERPATKKVHILAVLQE